jgi:hypothetical protein
MMEVNTMSKNSRIGMTRMFILLCSLGVITCSSKSTDPITDSARRFADDPVTGWVYQRYIDGLEAVYWIASDTMRYRNPVWDTCFPNCGSNVFQFLKFSHHIHTDSSGNPIKDAVYYENIGKYDQFAYGWRDFKNGEPLTSPDDTVDVEFMTPHRRAYLNLWRY